jgi:hypothetical protein
MVKISTCEIAILGGLELGLKDRQKARPTPLSQACNSKQFHRSKNMTSNYDKLFTSDPHMLLQIVLIFHPFPVIFTYGESSLVNVIFAVTIHKVLIVIQEKF